MQKLDKKSGFTLIELLIVVFLISVLTISAVSSYINSTATFNFLESYKRVMSSIKATRSYAITNQETNGKVPARYGIQISAQKVTVFADDGETPFSLDTGVMPDTVIKPKEYDFSETTYQLQALDSSDAELTLPVTLYYEIGKADLTTKYGNTNITLEKSDHKFLYLKFTDSEGEPEKYIVIFQISGLPEEYEKEKISEL